MLRNRKWWIVLGAIALMTLLAGCAPTTAAITTGQMADSGSWWTRNVVYWFSLMLDTFADWFGGEYGLSILVLTIIVRTIILPLMIKQYKNTKAMQALQPEMQKLREKFKDDPRKQQEEMMKLYQTHQVNPLAGCLPLIVQMPIFIALYNSIYQNVEIRDHSFIGFQLGTSPSQGEWYYYIIPTIAAITTLVQSMMMSRQQTMAGPIRDSRLRSGPTPKGMTATMVRKNSTPTSAPPPARMESLRSRTRRAIMRGSPGERPSSHAQEGGIRPTGRRCLRKTVRYIPFSPSRRGEGGRQAG